MQIPKIIHIAWNDKNVLESSHPLIVNGLRNLRDLNPDWTIEISDDNDIEAYLRNTLNENDYGVIKDIKIVPKTDVWRLLKMYYVGGLYIDIDRYCNISLDSFLTEDIRWVLPVCDYKDFSHDFMMTAPDNPAFFNALQFYFDRRYSGYNNTYFLGAQTYMHALTYTFFGRIVDVNPGKKEFEEMLEFISSNNFIKTFVEKPPENTIVYNGGIKFNEWAEVKKSFYRENKIKHWTGEW